MLLRDSVSVESVAPCTTRSWATWTKSVIEAKEDSVASCQPRESWLVFEYWAHAARFWRGLIAFAAFWGSSDGRVISLPVAALAWVWASRSDRWLRSVSTL